MIGQKLRCSHPDHSQKEITLVCLNQQCDKLRLACSDCFQENHSSHQSDFIYFSEMKKQQIKCFKIIEQVKEIMDQMKTLTQFLNEFTLNYQFDNYQAKTYQQFNNYALQMMQWMQIDQIKEFQSIKELLMSIQNQVNLINKCNLIRKKIYKIPQDDGWGFNSNEDKIYKPANYQLHSDIPVSSENCSARLAFNKDEDTLVAAFGSKIRIFKFKEGQLNEIQNTEKLESAVRVLKFLKQSNQVILALNNKIQIWGMAEKGQFELIQIFEMHHQVWVNDLTFNKAECLIITASGDKTIKFWKK